MGPGLMWYEKVDGRKDGARSPRPGYNSATASQWNTREQDMEIAAHGKKKRNSTIIIGILSQRQINLIQAATLTPSVQAMG